MPFFDGNGSWTWNDEGRSTPVAKSIHEENLWAPWPGGSPSGMTLAAKVGLSKNLRPEECFALSVSFQSGVAAYDRNLSRCRLRLFARNGEEVVAGRPVEFFKRPAPTLSLRQWLSALVHWWFIRGEMPAKLQVTAEGRLFAALPLDPTRLRPDRPQWPESAMDVVLWKYLWRDGTDEPIPSNRLMYDQCFNPMGDLRGLSPAFTGGTEITAGRNAALWAKKYFDNSTQPGGMLILPEGVPEPQRKDIERRFTQEHGASYGNAHRTFVISGSKDVKYEPLEQGFNDGNAFLELQKFTNKKVGQLLGVPDIEMGGVEDDTRFKMAPEARKVFFEQRLAPLAERISELLQHQLVDPFMQFEKVEVRRPRKPQDPKKEGLSKSMRGAFDKALQDRPDSRLVVMLDHDTLPIMGDVQLARSTNMIAFRDATMCSPRAACEFFDVDIEDDRPERDILWVDQKYLPASEPELAKKLIPGLQPKPAGSGGDSPPKGKKGAAEPVVAGLAETPAEGRHSSAIPVQVRPDSPPPLSPDERERVKAAAKFLRWLRAETLERMGEGKPQWSLAEVKSHSATDYEALDKQICATRIFLRKMLANHVTDDHFKSDADREAAMAKARDHFNSISEKSAIRQALGI